MNFGGGKSMISSAISKPKNTKYVIKGLARYLWHFKFWLLFAIILTIVSNLFGLIGPRLSGMAINEMKGKDNVDFDKIYYYLILMTISYVVSSILSFILSFMMIRISQNIVKKLRADVFEKITNLPISYFDFNQTGDIISKISYDIDTINTSLSSDVVMILSAFITILGSLYFMILIEPLLVLVFAVTIPLSIFITRVVTKRNKKHFKQRSMYLGMLNGFVEEKISGLKTIKAYNQEENTIEEFNKVNLNAVDATYKAEYYSSTVGPLVNFVNNLSLTLISVFGAILMMRKPDSFKVGDLTSFVMYSRKFSGPINEMANITSEIQSAFAAAERVLLLLDEKNEVEDSKNAMAIKEVLGKVVTKDVNFGYKENKLILKNINFNAEAGKTIAIVGPTGGGKTTIINLLMRFYELNSGVIYVDDKNITDLTKDSLRNSYAMVLQETWVFTGSIYENVSYGSKNKTKEDVINACKAAKIHNYIKKLPQAYDTILTEDGSNISKGQKQLLTIARAMLLDAKMLILDEATSNVDTKTEQEIQQAMLELMKNKTCFVIAHRLSTIANADLILVVKNGELIEHGTHSELLFKKGFYHELYNSQFA